MKNNIFIILKSLISIALLLRLIFLYDIFYGINELFGTEMNVLENSIFEYGSSLILIGVILIYILRFRKDKKWDESQFFVFLVFYTIADLLLSYVCYLMD